MKNNLLKLFGKIRRFDSAHADEGFQFSSNGDKVRIERRHVSRRRSSARRNNQRCLSVDRRVDGLERRLGIDWRSWIR